MTPSPFDTVADVLRQPQRLIDGATTRAGKQRLAATSLVLCVLGGLLFGAAVGSFRGPLQATAAAVKIPIATVATMALCSPAFYAFAATFRRRWSYQRVLAVVLTAAARSSLVLMALAPLLWIAIDLGLAYHGVRLAAVAAYALAGLSALSVLLRALGDEPGRVAAALSFVALFFIVGAQSTWLLRPYLGDPRDEDVPFLTQRQEGGLGGVLLESVEQLGRRPDPRR